MADDHRDRGAVPGPGGVMIRTFGGWMRRLRGVFSGAGDADLADELACHLQLHIDDNLRAGMAPSEARRQALVKLGGLEQSIEACREQRTAPLVESILRDAGYGVRVLAKHRGFAAAAIIVLGLGIGANTAIFSVVNGVMLRPLPFPDSDRLVAVWHVPPPELFAGRPTFAVSPANYLDWHAQAEAFESLAIFRTLYMNLTGRGEPTALTTAAVSPEFFPALGAPAQAGRTLDAQDAAPGREQVLVLKERVWRTRFGADPHLIGSSVHVDSRPFTVVGIVADRFAFPDDVDAWVPLVWTPVERAVRGNHSYAVIGRLKRGIDIKQARAEMTTISERLARQYPEDDRGWGAVVRTLHEDLVGDARPALLVLLGAVTLVALIACANLANLLLAKTVGRAKEIALRTALGATRRRVVRQLLTESVLLGLGGAALGAFIGQVGLSVILATIGERLPRVHEIGLDRTVLAFTCLLGVLTSVGAAAVPAWRLTHGHAIDPLKQRDGSHAGQRRLRSVLVVSEVAMAMMLLVGAGLLLRTLWNLQAVDPGFEPRGVLTMSVSLSPNRYPTPEARARFYDASLQRLRALPGVAAAGGVDSLPLQGGSTQPVAAEGQPPVALSDQPQVQVRRVSIDYRRTLRMRLAAGRDFSATDTADRPPVVLISESMARRFWPNADPIGRHLTLGLIDNTAREIVGVVNDVKYLGLDVRDPVPSVYVPIAQVPSGAMSYVVRAPGGPETVARAVERAIHEVDPEQPVLDVMTLDAVVGRSLESQRFAMLLLTTFAGLALLLAAVGIYSVLSYSVTQRVPEIGIQMALGAPIVSVIGQVVVEGLKPALIGLAVGIAGASALAGVLNELLFGVTVRDLSTIGVVSLLVMVVTVFATVVPARRATLVDPMVALRAE
jgi:putative ABC transport system permease protein